MTVIAALGGCRLRLMGANAAVTKSAGVAVPAQHLDDWRVPVSAEPLVERCTRARVPAVEHRTAMRRPVSVYVIQGEKRLFGFPTAPALRAAVAGVRLGFQRGAASAIEFGLTCRALGTVAGTLIGRARTAAARTQSSGAAGCTQPLALLHTALLACAADSERPPFVRVSAFGAQALRNAGGALGPFGGRVRAAHGLSYSTDGGVS